MSLATKAEKVSEIGKILASKTRCLILSALEERGEVCVTDIAKQIGLTQSATSHQLAKLEQANILDCVREGKTICYSFSDSKKARKTRNVLKKLSE